MSTPEPAPSSPAAPEIRIRAEPQQNDTDLCRFTVSRKVAEGGPFFYSARASAQGSPLPSKLFDLAGVTSVHIAGEVVTVGKRSDIPWTDLMRPIGALIRAQIQSGEPAVARRQDDAPVGRPRNDAEILSAVQRVLDEGINPFVANHGGEIKIDRVEAGVVYLQMQGGCQGCSSASATLRHGVEAMIYEEIPEVKQVVDLTDHAEGATPYM